MSNESLLGMLFVAPLIGLFLVFLGALYLRSRYNQANPDSGKTPRQRAREKIINYSALGLLFAVAVFYVLKADSFKPTWTIIAATAWIMFCLGEAYGRWSAGRQPKADR